MTAVCDFALGDEQADDNWSTCTEIRNLPDEFNTMNLMFDIFDRELSNEELGQECVLHIDIEDNYSISIHLLSLYVYEIQRHGDTISIHCKSSEFLDCKGAHIFVGSCDAKLKFTTSKQCYIITTTINKEYMFGSVKPGTILNITM
jgi:hypothetical protein